MSEYIEERQSAVSPNALRAAIGMMLNEKPESIGHVLILLDYKSGDGPVRTGIVSTLTDVDDMGRFLAEGILSLADAVVNQDIADSVPDDLSELGEL